MSFRSLKPESEESETSGARRKIGSKVAALTKSQMASIKIAQKAGKSVGSAAGAKSIMGLHAQTSVMLAGIVDLGLCVKGNHKWIRDPALGFELDQEEGELVYTGTLSHKCSVCGLTLNLIPGTMLELKQLIPWDVLEGIDARLNGLGARMKAQLDNLMASPSYDDYVTKEELWRSYEATYHGIMNTKDKIVSLCEQLEMSNTAIDSIKDAYTAIKEEYEAQVGK